MKPVVYHCEAEVELVSAAKYYECQRKRLGHKFLHAVHLALGKIQREPDRYPIYDKPARAL